MTRITLCIGLTESNKNNLQKRAKGTKQPVGDAINEALISLSFDEVCKALKERLDGAVVDLKVVKRTSALVTKRAYDNLTFFSKASGLPKDLLVQLAVEKKELK